MHKQDMLQQLVDDFIYYRQMTIRYLEIIGRQVVSLLEYLFDDGFVQSYQVGDYDEENCISIRTRSPHGPEDYLVLRAKHYEPLSQILSEELRNALGDIPSIYITDDVMLSPEQADAVRTKIRQWLRTEVST